MDQILSIILPAALILFWLILFIVDRIKAAKIRRQASKFEYHHEYKRPPKPWGIYVLGILSAVFFLHVILSRAQESHLNSYNQGYEDGFQAGIEEVLSHPGTYF